MSYLEDNSFVVEEAKFMKEMDSIISESFSKLNQKEGVITESLEFLHFSITRYEIFDLIKNRIINICIDSYGDLGKFLRKVNEYQDEIFKSLTK